MNIKTEISVGEFLDKITILQIKSERIQDADKLAMAMTARCYDESQVIISEKARKKDWVLFGCGVFFWCVLVLI